MNTITQKLHDLMTRSGIPFKDLWFGGSTGHATFWSHDAALKAGRMFQAATFRVVGPVKSIDYTKASEGRSKGRNDLIEVYRIGIRI